jgi:class 3 adenylate cyclase/tetratricopeptide (TPR) repeat protein
MRCTRCQHEAPSDAEFCPECGGKLELGCPQCGTGNASGYKFCKKCGQPLAPAAADLRQTAPRSYTPQHLAQRILTSRTALEGERKLVTVLFCDIANSTALAERVGPEGMHSLLNRFFELGLAEIHRYEGTINQFLGDGFMALFGAPLAHEDHARRGVLAALGIHRSLYEDQGDLRANDARLEVRMGLNTGPVVVGKIGDNLRMDYTAVGDTTNLAARLQQAAEPGSILVGEATSRLVQGYARVEPVPPLQLKGKSDAIRAFTVMGVGLRHSPLEGREERDLSPFVGRQRELSAFLEVLTQVEAGQGQIVGIAAEPGVGKSRLLYEFRRSLEGRPVTYLEGRCLSYGSAIPYVPVLDHVRQNCGIVETDSPEAITGKARCRLQEVGMGPDEWMPYLLQFLGLKEGTERLAGVGPETIKARTFETLRLMSLNDCRRQPLILAVEDLHWIDKSSEEYLASLVESLADAPILLLTTYRPGYRPPWMDKSYASQIALRPLSTNDSLRVVQSVVRRAPLGEAAASLILSKAEGNPFFLEELTRVVLEQGDSGAGLAIPDTVQGVLMARIDRLPEDTKRVLQTASVLGREFSRRLLAALWDGSGDLESQLRELKRLEFLYERTGRMEPVYVFKHALTQDVAYESLLTSRRGTLHEKAGRALETLYADRVEDYYEVLAYHYGRSAETDKAFEYLERANQKAVKANAMAEAKAYFDDAMKLLDGLPTTEGNQRRRITLLVNQVLVFRLLFLFSEYHAFLSRYEPVAVKLGEPGLLGRLYGGLAYCEFAFGQLDRSIEISRRAAELGEAVGDAQGAGLAYVIWEWCHLWKGDYDQVLGLKEQTLGSLARQFHLRWYALAFFGASWALTCLGRWDAAVAEAQQGLKAGEQASDDSVISYGAYTTSCAYTSKGDLARAIEWGELAVRKAVTPSEKVWSQTFLAWAWCRAGGPERGVALLAQLVPITRAARFVPFATFHTLWLCEGYWRVGEYDRARHTLEELLEVAGSCGMRFVIASAHRLLGEIALATNPRSVEPPPAALHFETSIAILSNIKAENELALSYAGYGRLHRQQGRIADARDYLTRALEIFERLGTLVEPDKVRAELAELEEARA